jgi:hypothetical protein
LATAMYLKNDKFECSTREIRTTLNYAKKAYDANPVDKKVQELYIEIKAKFAES